MEKGKHGFSRFYEVNLRFMAVGTWIALAPFMGDQRILKVIYLRKIIVSE